MASPALEGYDLAAHWCSRPCEDPAVIMKIATEASEAAPLALVAALHGRARAQAYRGLAQLRPA